MAVSTPVLLIYQKHFILTANNNRIKIKKIEIGSSGCYMDFKTSGFNNECGTGSNGVCGEHSRDCIEFEGNNPKILYNTAGCANVVCGSSTVARLKKASYTGLCNGNRRRFTRHHRDLQVEEEEKEEEAEARDIYVGDYEYDNEETKAEDFFFNAVMENEVSKDETGKKYFRGG